MSYIEKRVFEGETIVYRGEFHWLHKLAPWLALIFLGVFLIGIYLFIKMMVHIKTTEFVVTSRRVIIKRGFFNARMDELALDAMEGAHTRQSLFGRLFGYGDVRISGRGEGGLDLPVMARPGQFVAATERARSDAEHAPMDHLADELHNDLAGVA
ncbi:MAG: hypothetical protein CME88_13980 [Hirschia sp.]|nr:hypothetical protein [Hirschia sp.]MBF19481.1 hypothetical protein [Hirschia sp.]|tara:strand:+ start:313 stop:777 length:465 start_codon:yes stop_codon:yes gene_type:complete